MDNIFEIKDIVWFLIGWILPEIIKRIFKLTKKINYKRKIGRVNREYIENDELICPLSHGIPFFEKSNLVLGEPIDVFHLDMPEEVQREICKKNENFYHTSWENKFEYWGEADDTKLIQGIRKLINNKIEEEDIRGIIKEKKIEVAELFLARANEAFFNGEMYGIRVIQDSRVGNEEKPRICTKNIKTDYYTHRVMAAVYQELLKQNKIVPPEGLLNINLYYPFLTSIGMDVLLVIENKSKVVLTKRSKQLINMVEDQWHLSMNEAISITDLEVGTINLERCVSRGLKEELGIVYSSIDDIKVHFSDLFFLKDPFEVGILAFVVADNLFEADVKQTYNIAQDAPLESTGNDLTGLKFIKLKNNDISVFCSKNKVTAAAKYALKMLCIRKDVL